MKSSKLKRTCQIYYTRCKNIPNQDLTEYIEGTKQPQSDEWYEEWMERLEDIIFAYVKNGGIIK
jgi:hypothetical protein